MIAAWLASIALFVPLPSNVNVIVAPCPQVPNASCAQWDQHTVYLDPSTMSRDVLAHELGHLWDMQHMTDAARGRWTWPGDWYFHDLSDIDSGRVPGGEAFADAYVLCAHTHRWRDAYMYYGGYGEHFKRAKVAQTCWLLRHPPVIS